MLLKAFWKPIKVMSRCKKNRPLSQKFNEILRFENFEITRFCLTLTHENYRNSLNFWDKGIIFWIYSSFYVFYKSCLATEALWPIFKYFVFLVPPSERGLGKNSNLNFAKNFYYWYLGKVEKFQYNNQSRFKVITNLRKWWRLAPPPSGKG